MAITIPTTTRMTITACTQIQVGPILRMLRIVRRTGRAAY